jgi:glycylpeptide N-tetradecanoyltransferase
MHPGTPVIKWSHDLYWHFPFRSLLRSHAMSSSKSKEILDTTKDGDDFSDLDGVEQDENQPSTSQKKKKKKKIKKALNALRAKDEIPQQVVNRVMDKVKEGHGEGSLNANEENVRAALEQLRIMDVAKGKAGLGGKNKKDMGQHKVCTFHPVWTIFYVTSSFGERNPSHN